MERHRVHVETEGGSLLGLGNACPYNPEGYGNMNTDTYYGEALAVVRADSGEDLYIKVWDGERQAQAHVYVKQTKS